MARCDRKTRAEQSVISLQIYFILDSKNIIGNLEHCGNLIVMYRNESKVAIQYHESRCNKILLTCY